MDRAAAAERARMLLRTTALPLAKSPDYAAMRTQAT